MLVTNQAELNGLALSRSEEGLFVSPQMFRRLFDLTLGI